MSTQITDNRSIPKLWQLVPFQACIADEHADVGKLQQKEYLSSGQFAVVDQGQDLIAGYSDREDFVYKGVLPVVLFGDHTRIFKYIDFPFICGADGVKVLIPNRSIIEPEFFFFALQNLTIPNRGYSRHFQFLRQKRIPLPPLPEQQRIVAILRKADELRRLRRQANARASGLLPSIFSHSFGNPIVARQGWKTRRLGEFVEITSRLVDPRDEQYQKLMHIGSDNIESFSGRLIDLQTIGHTGSISGKFLFSPDHVLYSKIRPALVKVATPDFDGLCSADIYPLTYDASLVRKLFLAQLLRGTDFTAFAMRVSGRAQIPKVNRDDLLAYKTVLPDIDTQDEFEHQALHLFAQQELTDLSSRKFDVLFESLLADAFTGNLTTSLRATRNPELVVAAAERDRQLGIAQHVRRAEITSTPDTNDQAAPEAASQRSADVYPARHALLRSLSATQDAVFRTMHRAARYMTVDALAEQAGISLKQVAHTIDLLVRAGVVQAVSIPTDPTGDQTVYVRAYRPVRDSDDARVQDINDLEALAA